METDREWAVVIPTRSDRLEMLYALVDTLSSAPIVLVHTSDEIFSPNVDGCLNLQYEGPINIQAWWTHGIQATERRFVLLSNDDVGLPYNPVPQMVDACLAEGRAMARITQPKGHSGFFFLIDTFSGIEPDCGFQWWWGDDDLYRQAERSGGIVDIELPGMIHKGGDYGNSPAFSKMIREDHQRYIWKWGEGNHDAPRGMVVGSVHRRAD